MLFNSYSFIFVFLPVVIIGFFSIAPKNRKLAIFWLVISSLVFYGWWNPRLVIHLLCSIILNFFVGANIVRQAKQKKAKNF